MVPGAREVLASLVTRYAVVAVISGRPVDQLRELVGADGVRYEGLYGLAPASPVGDELRAEVGEAVGVAPGAWVEPKGMTLAVHYRHAGDPVEARSLLAPVLGAIAMREGYDLIEGKMVFELAPAGESRKGGAVRLCAASHCAKLARSSASSSGRQRERAVGIVNACARPSSLTAAAKRRYCASVSLRSLAGSAAIGGSKPSRQWPSMKSRSCGLPRAIWNRFTANWSHLCACLFKATISFLCLTALFISCRSTR